MGLKSGLYTTAAQHLTSLAMSFDDILKFVPSWNLYEIAEKSTKHALDSQLGKNIDITHIVNSVVKGESFGVQSNLSLAQWCEEVERKRILTALH